jgi:hypothetical protein
MSRLLERYIKKMQLLHTKIFELSEFLGSDVTLMPFFLTHGKQNRCRLTTGKETAGQYSQGLDIGRFVNATRKRL